MRTNYWKRVLVLILVGAMTLVSTARAKPKNVIFFIGDGMGFEHVEAASLYLGRDLCFESFAYQGQVRTYPADVTVITDSAAGGTALATGRKVLNGVVSLEIPGDGDELETVLEYYKNTLSKRTGMVTTTYMTHATPATFGAHEDSRNNLEEIAIDYFTQDPLINVLFGGGGNGLDNDLVISKGYTIEDEWDAFLDLDESLEFVSFQLGNGYLPYEYDEYDEVEGYPQYLSNMTDKALAILEKDPDGFFLMVEGGRIDHACHDNDFERMIGEMIEFDVAVQVAIDWVDDEENGSSWSDTLILVTSDHETGGLDYYYDEETEEWKYDWSSRDHTDADVPVYALGVNAGLVRDVMDNTFMFTVVTADVEPVMATNPYPADGVINLDIEADLSWRAGSGAESHNVYFGKDVLELVSSQTETVYEPGSLIPNTTYYWRIDEVCAEEVVEGVVWSFTTVFGALYVSDISMDYSREDEWYAAQATVTIDIDLDNRLGTTIRDATVCGKWYYNDNGSNAGNKVMMPVEGVVGPNGKVTLESPHTTDGGVFKFEVTDIVKTDLVYCPEFNTETSDSITVP